jgi:hypothetical protein
METVLGLGKLVEQMTKGRIGASNFCHEDPMFQDGRWAFGQTGPAQSHLERNGVGVGDVFLFFGLFSSIERHDRHHRIFGYMEVDAVRRLGYRPSKADNPEGFVRRHPHTIGEWNENNTLYLGSGVRAKTAPDLDPDEPRDLPTGRSPGHHAAAYLRCLHDLSTQHDPGRASTLAWRIRADEYTEKATFPSATCSFACLPRLLDTSLCHTLRLGDHVGKYRKIGKRIRAITQIALPQPVCRDAETGRL